MVAPWRGCRHPAAKNVEVHATHLGLAHNSQVYRQVGQALPTFWPTPDQRAVKVSGSAAGPRSTKLR